MTADGPQNEGCFEDGANRKRSGVYDPNGGARTPASRTLGSLQAHYFSMTNFW